jgi:Ca-activated chloride channel family protein
MQKKTLLALMVVGLALTGTVLAQAPVADPNIVYIPVAVNGPKNVYVPSLKKENFRLLEDGIQQTVTSFHAEDQPIDIDIILALGALQRGRADLHSTKIREAVENFRQQGNPKNKYTVNEMPFGANGIFAEIDRSITRLATTSTNPRRLLLVLTDGFEASGGDPARTLQEYAKKLPIPIYIVFAAGASAAPSDITELGRGQAIHLSGGAGYEDLARFTGGRLYQAEADTQLRANLEALAQELKNQYVLGYKSTNDAKDDKWRKIEVKMLTPPAPLKEKDLKVKVRDRYFVAKPKK